MKQNMENREKFEAQALPQLKDLYRTAMYVMDNEHDAQNLVQESFIRAYQAWPEGQFSSNCRIWLFRIMANVLISEYWPSLNLSAALNSADDINGYLESSPQTGQRSIGGSSQVNFPDISVDDIRKTIRSLPEDFRLIVVLSLLEKFSYQEIADIAGSNLETVRSRLYQGRKLLRKELFSHVTFKNNYVMPSWQSQESKSGR